MNQQENREIRISPDALIALVVAEAEDRELSAMPSLEEMNAAFHPSEEFQKKMDRLLKQAKRKQERKGAWRATKRLFVVATTVVTAFACILMPVQAVQEAVVSTVLNWRDQFVEILYSKEDDPNAVILLQNVELTYLPEGFTETPSNRTSNTSFWNTITDATRTRKKVIYEKLLFTITRINVQLYFYGLCICSRTLR